ncbi:MAG: DUF4390 domain-containing protein [Simplicispira suum]|uniref:DUF4390 domain-containing protein n=1 Tax=Simplicispira suum TaxID=2109915 RepID=UPI001C6BE0F6|nr:DUF4390 domain-containing protein [Simplicispira suum]MBW7833872.1 DUF4390 domain-containing protein [Simplicispira suum]
MRSACSRLVQVALSVLVLWISALVCAPVRAQGTHTVAHMDIERNAEGLFLNVSTEFSLPGLVEDALQKGIPMTFVADAEVVRARWYWSDQIVSSVHRYMRLTYQPLTQRWRLNVSASPFDTSGLGVSVGQTYDQLPDVLGAMQRIAFWKIADSSDLDDRSSYRVHFRFQLDMSQLPRPLQIGALGRSGWNLSIARTERVPALAAP